MKVLHQCMNEEYVLWAVRQILRNIWPLTWRSWIYSEMFVAINIWYANIVANTHTLGQNKWRYLYFQQFYRFQVCVTLTFDNKVMLAICNLRFSIHIMRNCCVKYEHNHHQYTKEEFVLWAVWQFLRIFDFDPWSRSYPFSETFVEIYGW